MNTHFFEYDGLLYLIDETGRLFRVHEESGIGGLGFVLELIGAVSSVAQAYAGITQQKRGIAEQKRQEAVFAAQDARARADVIEQENRLFSAQAIQQQNNPLSKLTALTGLSLPVLGIGALAAGAFFFMRKK